jgi:hypothetical protein
MGALRPPDFMIYLRFLVRPTHLSESENFAGDVAEFMFDAEDPRECTRKAVEILRSEGWRAISLSDAQEGFAVSDFVGQNDFEPLYTATVKSGLSYTIHAPAYAQAAI